MPEQDRKQGQRCDCKRFEPTATPTKNHRLRAAEVSERPGRKRGAGGSGKTEASSEAAIIPRLREPVDILPLFVIRASALIRAEPRIRDYDPPLHRRASRPGKSRCGELSTERQSE